MFRSTMGGAEDGRASLVVHSPEKPSLQSGVKPGCRGVSADIPSKNSCYCNIQVPHKDEDRIARVNKLFVKSPAPTKACIIFSVLILRRSLSLRKIVALIVLTIGVMLVQLDKMDDKASRSSQPQNHLVGLFAVLGACCTSGFGGVYFESVLKVPAGSSRRPPSVWAKNVQLSMFAFMFALAGALLHDGEAITQGGFFQGFSPLVLAVIAFEAGGGLVVAVVIKYADNILKSFATAVSIITSTVVSMYVFGFLLSRYFLLGGALIFSAIWLYSNDGIRTAKRIKESPRPGMEMSERSGGTGMPKLQLLQRSLPSQQVANV